MDEVEHMDETKNEDELDYKIEFTMWWKSPHTWKMMKWKKFTLIQMPCVWNWQHGMLWPHEWN